MNRLDSNNRRIETIPFMDFQGKIRTIPKGIQTPENSATVVLFLVYHIYHKGYGFFETMRRIFGIKRVKMITILKFKYTTGPQANLPAAEGWPKAKDRVNKIPVFNAFMTTLLRTRFFKNGLIVKTLCFLFLNLVCALALQAQTVTVGTGDDEPYHASLTHQPFGNFFSNDRSAGIYLGTEIGTSGTITSIG